MCHWCVRELTKCQKIKPSLFSISKNGGTTELIQICCRYDVISKMCVGFTPTALSETLLYQKQSATCFGSHMVFVYISKHR